MKKKLVKIFALVMTIVLFSTLTFLPAMASGKYSSDLSISVNSLRKLISKRSDELSLYYISNEFFDTAEKKQSYVKNVAHELVKHTGSPFEGDYLNYTIESFHSTGYGFVKSGSKYYVATSFKCTYVNSTEEQALVENSLNTFVNSLELKSVDTDYFKLTSVYDYVVDHINDNEFVSLGDDESLRAALMMYAGSILTGLDSRIVSGDNHYWNIVFIDGNWYNVDATESEGFLVSDSVLGLARDEDCVDLPSCSMDYTTTEPSILVKTLNLKDSGEPRLVWNRTPGITAYEVYRRTDESEPELIASLNLGNLTDENAEPGVKYYYTVKCNIAENEVVSSDEVALYARAERPHIKSVKKKRNIKVVWSGVEGGSKYYVYKSDKKYSGYKKVATTTKHYYLDKKGKRGKRYYYKIKAVPSSLKGISVFSNRAYRIK